MADYKDGFTDGWLAAVAAYERTSSELGHMQRHIPVMGSRMAIPRSNQTKKARKQSGKAAILTKMTKPIWEKYKKGKGKQTYFDIRSGVSRSASYKKKTKGM